MKKKIIHSKILILISISFFLYGCGESKKNPDEKFDIHYIEPSFEKEETELLLGN
jgi:hypothetical protein